MGEDVPRQIASRPTTGDRIFRILATVATSASFLIVALTFVFLVRRAWPAVQSSGVGDFFTTSVWGPAVGRFGVKGLLLGSIVIASVALLVGVPLALGMALFINEYAPSRVRSILTGTIDLLAALPSLLFGIWGAYALQPLLLPTARWASDHLYAIPFLRTDSPQGRLDQFTQSSFIAGVVVGLMVIPIITSVSRDVMAQVPREQCEGALALGGTRWGMIRTVILPFGRSGIIGSIVLGFGRALGETIAVALIIKATIDVNWNLLLGGQGSIPAYIVTKFSEASGNEINGLVGAGLALFVVTFLVNLAARVIVNRTAVKA
jgi:phosphate transport system permease protein